MRVAVIGSRGDRSDCRGLILENLPDGCSEIVSGGAQGVDSVAKRLAEELGIRYVAFLPDYAAFGKSAPLKRNRELLCYADFVLAVWDGHSKGTAFVIGECVKSGKPFRVVLLPSNAET